MAYAEDLRKAAAEKREHAEAMRTRLGGHASLAVEILAVADNPNVPEDARSRLRGIADRLGGSEWNSVILTIIGHTTANFYDILADQTDYLMAKGALRTAVDKMRAHHKVQSNLRTAAASGNWEKFDEYVEQLLKPDNQEQRGKPAGPDAESGNGVSEGPGRDSTADEAGGG